MNIVMCDKCCVKIGLDDIDEGETSMEEDVYGRDICVFTCPFCRTRQRSIILYSNDGVEE